jgi:NosR/NirI family nitrous oxide reductase transcriptional regulator
MLVANILFALLALMSRVVAAESDYPDHVPPLLQRLTPDVLAKVYPQAGRLQVVQGKGATVVAVYDGDAVAGYIFSTLDVVRAPGYSGTPFDVIAGVDLSGHITGAVNLFQREPHIVNDDRRTALLTQYMGMMAGLETTGGRGPSPDFIAGATVSARSMREAIRDSARMVLSAQLNRPVVTEPTIDVAAFRPMTQEQLLADRSIVERRITNADLAAAMKAAGASDMIPEVDPVGGPTDTYIDLKVGLATPPMIGRNATTAGFYKQIPVGSQSIVLGSDGPYDFQGFKFQNRSSGYRLERLRIVQGEHTFEFDGSHYIRASRYLGNYTGIVILPPESGFDGLKPFRVEVLVYASASDGRTATITLPGVDYQLPAQHVLMPEPPPVPAWMQAWQEGRTNEIILGCALAALTLVLAFQSLLARNRRLHRWVRNGFLLFTVVWVGWIAGAQLSIVHVVNYVQAPFQNLDFAFYLVEPLIVMMAVYTVFSLIVIGRGVFCGWLCPFGALQELLAQVARFLRLPQWNPSEKLQSKLWLGKYASVAIVLALVFLAPTSSTLAEEVEPFKTAITSQFAREWPYVIYAVALLAVGLFTERAYCRFLCPLGGTLAILDRLHLLNLLKRRPECGSPCQLCKHSCPVGAIKSSGKIKMAECFQCLDCQVEYYDDHRCPPLVRGRKQGVTRGTARPQSRPAAVPVPVSLLTPATRGNP